MSFYNLSKEERNAIYGTTIETFSDLYEIDNVHLNDVSSFKDLKLQLIAF